MNKSALIDSIVATSGLTKTDVSSVLDGFISTVTTELSRKSNDSNDVPSIALIGFGTFSVKNRAERKGRNPQTNQEITIKATTVPFFKAGKTLKDAVSGVR